MFNLGQDWKKLYIEHTDGHTCWCHPFTYAISLDRGETWTFVTVHNSDDEPPADVIHDAFQMVMIEDL